MGRPVASRARLARFAPHAAFRYALLIRAANRRRCGLAALPSYRFNQATTTPRMTTAIVSSTICFTTIAPGSGCTA